MIKFYRLDEGIEQRKFAPGAVKFSTSQFADPHIQKVVQAIAIAAGKTPGEIQQEVQEQVDKFADVAKAAPLLYKTILSNGVENKLFNLFMETNVPSPGPKFSNRIFIKLQITIAGEHDEFWPLRSNIEKRPLTPKWEFTDTPWSDKKGIPTAAATPDGTFIFNTVFMQKLMDYSHFKEVKPQGRKYVCNGGDIPDEYAYIEFLIMHELMHYSNDDFYYQKTIPNANPTIINWVGDFRSNYLLVKSGYEQLPMGLFNDDINFDRQKSYIDMYNIVAEEFKKLNKDQQNKVQQEMDEMSDDHKPGQEQGKNSDVQPGDLTPDQIDAKGKKIADQMKNGKDKTADEVKKGNSSQAPSKSGSPGQGSGTPAKAIDWSHVRPSFDWKTLVKRFLSTAKPRMEDTYSRPARRSVSQMDIARQLGSAAVKPGDRIGDAVDSKLAFVFDSSGSMQSTISTIFANAAALLKTPAFKKSTSVVVRFSDAFKMYKVLFGVDKAAEVSSFKDKVANWSLTSRAAFNMAESGGTTFSSTLADKLIEGLKDKWNIIIMSDTDIIRGDNCAQLLRVIKAAPGQVFIIFDRVTTYQEFRKTTGITTPNITYFG